MFHSTSHIPKVIFVAIKNVLRQKRFLYKEISPLVKPYLKTNDGSILPSEIKKIYSYYGLGVPAVLAEGFALLHNRKLMHPERMCATALGALTGLFDDYLDKKQGHISQIHSLIFEPEKADTKSDFERLFQTFAAIALHNIPDKKSFEKSIHQVIEMQLTTEKQHELSDGDLLQLTLEKGGKSLLFYRMALPENMNPTEAEALFHLGGLMQMGNDIFDVYEDIAQGTQTLFTRMTSINHARDIFIQQWQHSFFLIQQSSMANKHFFANMMAFGLARCFVCLDQYEKLEKISGTFQPHTYSRQQLICDMEKPKNLLLSFSYFLKHKKTL